MKVFLKILKKLLGYRLRLWSVSSCVCLLAALILFCGSVSASETVLILKSGNLPPINDAAEAFKSAWHGNVDILTVKSASETINLSKYSVVIAIGSRAAVALKSNYIRGIVALYGMILSPKNLTLLSVDFIGISPSSNFSYMLSDLQSRIGNIERIGVIYSKNSEYVFDSLRNVASESSVPLMGVEITSEAEIADALEKLRGVDLFYLMPDPLLIKEGNMTQILRFFNKGHILTVASHKIALLLGASYVYTVEPLEIGKRLAKEASEALKHVDYRPRMIFVKGRMFRK